MRSDAADVDAYLAAVPADRRAVLQAIRAACGELLVGFEESMRYGMPSYLRDGTGEIAWASQKQYISLYVTRTDVVAAHRDRLAGLSSARGASDTAGRTRSTWPSSARC